MEKNVIKLAWFLLFSPMILLSQVETIHHLDPSERVEMARPEPVHKVQGKVQFRTLAGYYLSAESGGGGPIHAKASKAGAFESFSLEEVNSGSLSSGDRVRIKTSNGRLVFADESGRVSSIYTVAQGVEVFIIEKAIGSGPLKFGDVVCLRSSGGKYLSAIDGGGKDVTANAIRPHFTEAFILSRSESQETADPEMAHIKREIMENGNVRLLYRDGTVKELFKGGMTVTEPNEAPQTILYSMAQSPDIPPSPDDEELEWLNHLADTLLNLISSLVGNDQKSIDAYLDSEEGLGIYEKINRRTLTIGLLLSS